MTKVDMILLDAGHGGIIKGRYDTPGKRYVDESIDLSEGAYNRMIVHGVAFKLHGAGVPVHIINPENDDISLKARARRVNEISRRNHCLLISVHQNAFSDQRAYGAEFFTSRGDTPSDPIAEYMAKQFKTKFPDRKLRTSQLRRAKLSKEAGYYILKSTICPAVLTEWAFMTNRVERSRMLSDSGIMEQMNFLASTLEMIFFNRHRI